MDRRIYENYVLHVVKYKSLTAAASVLGVSQPALSSGLSALEKELGFRIFNRKSVPVSFTDEGKLYYEYLQKARLLSQDYRKRIHECLRDGDCRVTVGAPIAYAESIVTGAAERMLAKNGLYKIGIRCATLPDLIEMALEGELDCFISTSSHLPEQFACRKIKRERLLLCVPGDDPINRAMGGRNGSEGGTLDASLLDGREFILLEPEQPLQKKADAFFERNGITPVSRIVVDQTTVALNLAAKGIGICFASEEALRAGVDLGKLCIYPISDPVIERDIFVAHEKNIFLTDACRELIGCLLDEPSR